MEQLDYQRIAQAIEFITAHARQQPELADIAAHLHLSPAHCQRLFSHWAGISPKRFLQVLTLDYAKRLLDDAQPLLTTAYAAGLSSASRLYDHFVSLDAMTPGEYQNQGRNLQIEYGLHETPFGWASLAFTQRGLSHLQFWEQANIAAVRADLQARWPQAQLGANPQRSAALIAQIFQPQAQISPLKAHIKGTQFQLKVWQALLSIPPGQLSSYQRIAEAIGQSSAARAVGNAVGANPLGFLIPCHRVIQQSGAPGGYRWGITRKRAIQIWETKEEY